MVMDDDDMRYFLHFYMRHSENLEITCFDFCFCLLFACLLKMDESFEMNIRDLKKNETSKNKKVNYLAERKMIRKISRETIEQVQLIRG